VDNPNEVLMSPNTSLVLVRGFLRPGTQEGDRFDVEVRIPPTAKPPACVTAGCCPRA